MNTCDPSYACTTLQHKNSQDTVLDGVIMRLRLVFFFSVMRSELSPDSASASLCDHGLYGHLVLPLHQWEKSWMLQIGQSVLIQVKAVGNFTPLS